MILASWILLLSGCSAAEVQTASQQSYFDEASTPSILPAVTATLELLATAEPTPSPQPTIIPTLVPTNLPPVEEMLALGDYHTCNLHSDGTVSCWGWNSFGQVGNPQTGDSEESYLFGLMGITQISAGAYHTCALDWLGRVFCWGRNNVGQLGNNQEGDTYQPAEVAWIAKQEIVQISAGSMHTCALSSTGKVYCWGSNHAGKLGAGIIEEYSRIPLPVSGLSESVVQVSAGGNHTCAVGISGNAWCWGDGKDGQLCNGSFEDSSLPIRITGLTKAVVKISSGWYHVCALQVDGSISCWGENEKGQLGNASTLKQARVVPAVGLYDSVSQLSVGGEQSCAVKNGTLFCWGDDNQESAGITRQFSHLTPYILDFRGEIQDLYLGGSHACILTPIGEIDCWGANDHNQLGDYKHYFTEEPPLLE